MSKKIKFAIWLLLGVAVLVLLGIYGVRFYSAKTQEIKHPEVTFEIENYGTVKMELYPEYAPNTVANFIKLVEAGYYNDKVVYGKDEICLYVGRNSEGEAINPKVSLINSSVEVDSDSDYEYTIPGEFVANGFEQNTLRHEKGVVSLIRNDYTQYFSSLSEQSYNSGNAQLGIMLSDNAKSLNGVYAAFGKITEGLDILEKIYNEQEIKVAEEETPQVDGQDTMKVEKSEELAVEDEEQIEGSEEKSGIKAFASYPVIKNTSVETYGEDYGMPEVEEAFDYNSYMYDLFSQYYSTEQ